MIKLKIDHREIEVENGTSLLEAASRLGIEIPTMCYLKGQSNHPSCMICVVMDEKSGKLLPSCAIPAQEGLNIITNNAAVFEARKDTLELLLSDHVGECEARCRVACPAFMDIPLMNRLIAENKPIEALKVVKEEIALPLILGYVCQAPCENACRRNSVDETVSICQLKKYVALQDAFSGNVYMPEKEKATGQKIAVIGAGPTGLAAAFHLVKSGFDCTVFDRNLRAGGSLLDKDQPLELPDEVLEMEIRHLRDFGVKFKLDHFVDKEEYNHIRQHFNDVLIATGAFDPGQSEDFGLRLNALKKGFEGKDGSYSTAETHVFVAGSSVRKVKMAVQALAEGKAAAHFISTLFKKGTGEAEHRMFNSKFSKLKYEEINEYLKESIPDVKLIPENELDGFTMNDAIREAERCLRCDCRKPVSCKLRIYAEQYGARQGLFKMEDRALVTKEFNHESIIYEPEKCIRCSLCVDIAENEEELIGWTHIGRGFDVRIGIPFNESLANSMAKTAISCAIHCPTAAISLKIGEERKLE